MLGGLPRAQELQHASSSTNIYKIRLRYDGTIASLRCLYLYANVCMDVEGNEDLSDHFPTVNEPRKKSHCDKKPRFYPMGTCTDHLAYNGSMKNTYV